MDNNVPRLNTILGYDYQMAILEAIDDSFEAAGTATFVDCRIFKTPKLGMSYVIADSIGNVELERLFNGENGEYISRFNSVGEINTKTGMFGSGSNSHISVGKIVFFITKIDGIWKALKLEKDFKTGTAKKSYTLLNEIENEYLDLIQDYLSEDSPFKTILLVIGVNPNTYTTVKDFEDDTDYEGFAKNLSVTYKQKLVEGYQIKFNNNLLKPIDVFHAEDNLRKNLFNTSITLKELLEFDPYMEEQVLAIYLPLYKKEFGSKAMKKLLSEKIKFNFWGFDSDYYKNYYFKQIAPNERIVFNQETSGAWLYRNYRKIGNPYRLQFMRSVHNSWNRLRIEVHFNPIFDVFFNINVNKNTGTVSKAIEALIDEKLLRKYSSFNQIKIELDNISHEDEPVNFDFGYEDSQDKEQLSLFGDESENESKQSLIERWRQAELICLAYLKKNGFEVEDVRNKKAGYDFIARHKVSNETRYVEVKKILKVGSTFRIERNEYLKADRLSNEYFVYLVIMLEDCAEILIFNDVVANAKFTPSSYLSVSQYSVMIKDNINYDELDFNV